MAAVRRLNAAKLMTTHAKMLARRMRSWAGDSRMRVSRVYEFLAIFANCHKMMMGWTMSACSAAHAMMTCVIRL